MSLKAKLKQAVIEELGEFNKDTFSITIKILGDLFNENCEDAFVKIEKQVVDKDENETIEEAIDRIKAEKKRKDAIKDADISDMLMKGFLGALFGKKLVEKALDSSEGKGPMANSDLDEKMTGDRVQITDKHCDCYMHDIATQTTVEKDPSVSIDDLANRVAIVINSNIDYKFQCDYCPNEHNSNLCIHYPELDRSFYIHSKMVKLVD